MPVDLIWHEIGVIYKGSGDVTGDEILSAARDMYSDPRWMNARFQIADLLEATSIEGSHFLIEELVLEGSEGTQKNPSVKKIVVYDRDGNLKSAIQDWLYKALGVIATEIKSARTLDEAMAMAGKFKK